jgi:hypothetical protein
MLSSNYLIKRDNCLERHPRQKGILSMCVGQVRQATLNEQAFWLLLRLKSNCTLPWNGKEFGLLAQVRPARIATAQDLR